MPSRLAGVILNLAPAGLSATSRSEAHVSRGAYNEAQEDEDLMLQQHAQSGKVFLYAFHEHALGSLERGRVGSIWCFSFAPLHAVLGEGIFRYLLFEASLAC